MKSGNSRLLPFICSISIWIYSCGDESVNPLNENSSSLDSLIAQLVEEREIDELLEGPNGILYYQIQNNNSGDPVEGKVANFYYQFEQLGGPVIDTYDESDGLPISARQGVNAIFPIGIDFGLGQMREGEIYGFILPPQMASWGLLLNEFSDSSLFVAELRVETVEEPSAVYGNEQSEINDFIGINQLNDTIIAPVEPTERLNSGVIFKRLTTDTTVVQPSPSDGDSVIIDYSIFLLSGPSLEDSTALGGAQDFAFAIGTDDILAGLQQGVRRMRLGERALIIIPSSEAYQESVQVIPDGFTRFGDPQPDQIRLSGRYDDFYREAINQAIIPEYAEEVPPYTTLMFTVRLMEIQ